MHSVPLQAVGTPSVSPGAALPDPIIRLWGLEKTYPGAAGPVINDMNLDIAEGELLALVGRSGSGKSTLLRLINRMIEPSNGRIILRGKDVTQMPLTTLRRQIGYSIQSVGLFPHWSIRRNVGVTPQLLGWNRDRIRTRIDEMLDLVGLDPAIYGDRYPASLSGGQAQRVGVARALAGDPDVLLMDEPFGAIDQIMRDRLQIEFRQIQQRLGKTVVFVTHDIEEAFRLADRVVVLMDGGRIGQIGAPHELVLRPANEFVADLVGATRMSRRLSLLKARDVATDGSGPVICDADGRPARWTDGAPLGPLLPMSASLGEALALVWEFGIDRLCLVDTDGRAAGQLGKAELLAALDTGAREA